MHNTHNRKITWQPLASEDAQDIARGDEFIETKLADEQTVMSGTESVRVRRRVEDIVDPSTSTVGRNIVLARSHIGRIEHIVIEEIGADE